jgi:hypothetical protein
VGALVEVFDKGNKGNYNPDDRNDWNGDMIDDGTLKSTGKCAKKRRSGVVVEDEQDAEENDEEDDGVSTRGLSCYSRGSRLVRMSGRRPLSRALHFPRGGGDGRMSNHRSQCSSSNRDEKRL